MEEAKSSTDLAPNGKPPPPPVQRVPVESAFQTEELEESTYEELKERPDPEPYTGLSAYAKPIDDSTRRKINRTLYDQQSAAPQYSNIRQ